jgi:hypothetical protein
VFPLDASTRQIREVAGLRNVAGRLHELLSETKAISPKLVREVSGALERLLSALTSSDGKAA